MATALKKTGEYLNLFSNNAHLNEIYYQIKLKMLGFLFVKYITCFPCKLHTCKVYFSNFCSYHGPNYMANFSPGSGKCYNKNKFSITRKTFYLVKRAGIFHVITTKIQGHYSVSRL